MAEKPRQLPDLAGQKITKVWRGYAGVLFFEIGQLHQKSEHSTTGDWSSERGDYTLMIESDWRLKKDGVRTLSVTESSYEDIDSLLPQLEGLLIENFTIDDAKEMIELTLSSGYICQVHKEAGRELVIFEQGMTVFVFPPEATI